MFTAQQSHGEKTHSLGIFPILVVQTLAGRLGLEMGPFSSPLPPPPFLISERWGSWQGSEARELGENPHPFTPTVQTPVGGGPAPSRASASHLLHLTAPVPPLVGLGRLSHLCNSQGQGCPAG